MAFFVELMPPAPPRGYCVEKYLGGQYITLEGCRAAMYSGRKQ